MTLFGKVMAILNVLAAGAFLFLAAQDYAVRQQWEYAVFKHQLAIDGLPVDADETDKDNRPIVPNIDDELARSISGDPTVKTLEQFLDLRKGELDRLLAATASEKQPAAYAELLAALARTEQERQQLLTGKVPLATLKQMYQAQFDAIPKLADREAQRQAIARLLVAWSDVLPDAQEQARRQAEYNQPPDKRRQPAQDPEIQRLAKVLGPKQVSRELADQSERIERLAFEVEDARSRARTNFVYMYYDLVNSLLPWHGAVADQEEFRLWKQKQANDQEQLALNQKKEVSTLRDQLEAAKQETARQMVRLTKQQDDLHAVRVLLRDADLINQMKETLIRKLEGLQR